jgi:hypothetical protein
MNHLKRDSKCAVKYRSSGKICFFLSSYHYNFILIILIIFSYDTEALNKQLLQTEGAEDQLFTNTFGDTEHKKNTLGVQQLYIIGNISNLYFL